MSDSKGAAIDSLKEKILDLKRPDKFTSKYVIEAELDDILAILAQEVNKGRIDELKNWRARTFLTANDALNIRVEMEARIKDLERLG